MTRVYHIPTKCPGSVTRVATDTSHTFIELDNGAETWAHPSMVLDLIDTPLTRPQDTAPCDVEAS